MSHIFKLIREKTFNAAALLLLPCNSIPQPDVLWPRCCLLSRFFSLFFAPNGIGCHLIMALFRGWRQCGGGGWNWPKFGWYDKWTPLKPFKNEFPKCCRLIKSEFLKAGPTCQLFCKIPWHRISLSQFPLQKNSCKQFQILEFQQFGELLFSYVLCMIN